AGNAGRGGAGRPRRRLHRAPRGPAQRARPGAAAGPHRLHEPVATADRGRGGGAGPPAPQPPRRVPQGTLPLPARRRLPVRPPPQLQPARRGVVRRTHRAGCPRQASGPAGRHAAGRTGRGQGDTVTDPSSFEVLRKAAATEPPHVGFILGSGMGLVARRLERAVSVPFAEVPGLAASSVAGHSGRLGLGDWLGRRVLIFEGRLHYYEGHPWESVTLPVRLAADLG